MYFQRLLFILPCFPTIDRPHWVSATIDNSSPRNDLHYEPSNSLSDVAPDWLPIPDRGHGNGNTHSMADPFEVRMRFTAQLQHLNASVTSSQKAAQYAIKYRDMDEDLHSCILEQLEKVCKAIHSI